MSFAPVARAAKKLKMTAREIGADAWLTFTVRQEIANKRLELNRAASIGEPPLDPLLPWAEVASGADGFDNLELIEQTLGAYRRVQHWEVAKTAALPELRRFVVLLSKFGSATPLLPMGRALTACEAAGGAPPSMRDLSREMLEFTLAAIGSSSDSLFDNENCLEACMYAVSYTLEHALGPTRLPSIEEDPMGLRGWAAMGGAHPMTRMMLFQLMKQLHLTVHQYTDATAAPNGVGELYSVLNKFKTALSATADLI
jgi:hypothetical protein